MIVTKRFLGREISFATSLPLGSCPSSKERIFIVEREKKAVSVADKKAEQKINKTKRTIKQNSMSFSRPLLSCVIKALHKKSKYLKRLF